MRNEHLRMTFPNGEKAPGSTVKEEAHLQGERTLRSTVAGTLVLNGQLSESGYNKEPFNHDHLESQLSSPSLHSQPLH